MWLALRPTSSYSTSTGTNRLISSEIKAYTDHKSFDSKAILHLLLHLPTSDGCAVWALRLQGDLEGAQAHLERAFAIGKQILGKSECDTATTTINNLGELLQEEVNITVAER